MREALFNQYAHLVQITANRYAPPAEIEREDLVSEGAIGLLQAIERFEPRRKVRFQTFAIAYIRGSILDALTKARGNRYLPLDAELLCDDRAGPAAAAEQHERTRKLAASLQRLPEREQKILCLYYHEDRTFTDIARQLGISATRAHQLHGQAIDRLRKYFQGTEGIE